MLRKPLVMLVALLAIIGSLALTSCSSRPTVQKQTLVDTELFYNGTVTAEHLKGGKSEQLVFTFKRDGGYHVQFDGNNTPNDFNFSPSPRRTKRSLTVSDNSFPMKVTVTKDGSAPQSQTVS